MISPEERSLIRALYILPGREPMPSDQFLREFGAADGVALGLDLLRDAVDRQDPVDVEFALTVCFTFDITDDHLPLLLILAFADWHRQHEDVASALQDIGSPESVDALSHLATWAPAYLRTDEAGRWR